MTETIGKREDDKAFEEMLEKFYAEHPYHATLTGEVLRAIFDAGMERGQEKRGCCHD